MCKAKIHVHSTNKPFYAHSLLCSHWNIEGHKSAIVGNKLEDHEFLKVVSKSDIVGLTELHAEEEVVIPGFKCIKFKKREKNSKGYKVGGGIGFFAKHEIAHLVQAMPNKSGDSIWVKLSKTKLEESEDIFIGTYYISPPNRENSNDSDILSTLNEELMFFNKKGIALVQGDLNARTGSERDYVEHDKFDQELGIENLNNQFLRNSQDLEVKNRGKELLDICKMNDFLIMNGRTVGDIYGRFTSHQWNGSSVVDYFIAPNHFSKRIVEFSIGEYLPWLSDHCPTHATILLKEYKIQIIEQTQNLTRVIPGFVWDENAKNIYAEGLKSIEIKRQIEKLINDDNITSHTLITEINNILLKNAVKSKLKKKKMQVKYDHFPAAWFDYECENVKQKIREVSRNLRKQPHDPCIRKELFNQKRIFKKLVKRKKYQYKCKELAKMSKMKTEKNQKEFWKLLKKISPNKSEFSGISPGVFAKHFESILSTSAETNICGDGVTGPLDYTITHEELRNAAHILKPGKATGIDRISNEMISCLFTNYPDIIIKLLNSIMRTNDIIPEWVLGVIVPIHKKGPKNNPSNYRGITLMSCLGKLFLTVLNNRLLQYCKDNKILSDKQLGFVAGNRTSDAHIVINNLVRKYCHKNGSKIYSCFVDFSKAFDMIPRDILLTKLRKFGINGNFFNIIKGIYEKDKSCVKIGNQYTETFDVSLGVRQGCVLSPLLFNIFMADLAKELDTSEGLLQVKNMEISSIFWADDIVMFSESEDGLNTMIKILERYVIENKLKINVDKTKVMIFNKTGRLMKRIFHFDGIQLENVRSYKYLGFLLTPSGEINSGLQDLRERALKAFMALKNSLGYAFNQDVETTLVLVDAMIKPILLYNSDFWGCMKLPKNNPIENLHMSICKQLLGVQKNTVNVGVLLELGRVPLSLYAIKYAIKNWERIRNNRANCLLIESYKESSIEKLPWILNIRKVLEENGMLNYFLNVHYDGKPCFVNKRIFQTLCDQFHQNTFEMIGKECSKLRTYAIFKNNIGYENYLSKITNPKIRTYITKLRLSNHSLMIETGRHKNISRGMRTCPLCHKGIEDEIHFLFSCPAYKTIRQELFISFNLEKPNFQFLSNNRKLEFLMAKIDKNIGKFIFDCFEIRTFLRNNPKRWE